MACGGANESVTGTGLSPAMARWVVSNGCSGFCLYVLKQNVRNSSSNRVATGVGGSYHRTTHDQTSLFGHAQRHSNRCQQATRTPAENTPTRVVAGGLSRKPNAGPVKWPRLGHA